jgi:ABC-2 type transport system ATP-binding protein
MNTSAESCPIGTYAIETRGVSKAFGDLVAVNGLDLTVDPGELFSLLGPNGAGKTTTIRMLCGLTRPDGGSAFIMGHDVVGNPIAVKSAIAVSPQETAIAEHLDAWENLSLMAGLHGVAPAETRTRSGELLEMMGLIDRAGERVKKYSGGMKRRLSIAMALVSDPEVLFLDEPTLGLDPQSRRAIWEHIKGMRGRKTILLTTHYLEEADALADRVAIIDEGRVVAHGTPEALKGAISGPKVTVVEARNLTAEAVEALRGVYSDVREVDGGLEIESDTVSLYEIEDCLRPRGVVIDATYTRHATLDDVFLEVTGKRMRD